MVRLATHGRWLSPLLVAACSTEPSTAPLVGSWGNRMVGVLAQVRVVELDLACGTKARFGGPVHPDAEGRFRLSGTARHFHGTFEVELVGQVRGARLSLTLTEIYDGSRRTSEEELLAGITPDFPGIVCLA